MVEHWTVAPVVAGSIPVIHPKPNPRDPSCERVSPEVGGEMNAKRFLVAWILLALSLGGVARATAVPLESRPPGEIGFLLGLSRADEDLVGAGDGSDTSPLFGLRWAARLSPNWNWFADGVYMQHRNVSNTEDTNIWEGRTGFERLFPLGDATHVYLAGSLGGSDVNFPSPPGGDFGRPLASLGLGISGNGGGLRGEVRAEDLLGDSGLNGADIINVQLILGYTFGLPAAESEADSDGDGVIDSHDKCPNTPPGSKVDSHGCPIKMPLFDETRKKIRLEGVNFEFDSDRLTHGSYEILDRVAAALQDAPNVRVEVAGHTDNTGTPAYNKDLSQRRAEAVRSYLISKGIDASRLTAKGYGETEPETSNDTDEGRAKNRRVELKQIEK